LTNRKVKRNLAMTGEITLRGTVLPVGGIKEKVLAAYRAGIKTILLPEWNKKDIEDIPTNVRKSISFHFIKDMMEVVRLALEPVKEKKATGTKIKKREKPTKIKHKKMLKGVRGSHQKK